MTGVDGTTIRAQCYNRNCQDWGHLAYNCPHSSASKIIATRASSDRIGVSNLQVSFGFAQKDKDIIPASWILLDTCSTVSIGNDSALIGTIEDCSEMDSLKVTNGGSKSFNQKQSRNYYRCPSIIMRTPWLIFLLLLTLHSFQECRSQWTL